MDIVFSDKKTIYLNTGLKETAFSKTASMLNFAEKGVLVRFNLFENNFQFSEWNFSGTNVIDDYVCFEGDAFLGKSALTIINSSDNDVITRMTFALNKIYSKAISSNISIPVNGLGGIYYNEKVSKKNAHLFQVEILFLPEALFDFACSNFDEKTNAMNQGCWQNKLLTSNNAHIFTQSVLTYFSITKILPFMKTETSARQEDITDSNFIKIEHLVNGINPSLASSINMGFNIDNQYERDSSIIDITLLKEELGLNEDGSVKPKTDRSQISQEEFEIKLKKKQKAVEKSADKKRFFKRNAIIILIILAALGIISNIIYRRYLDDLSKPCAKNLSSIEAIETFYSGFHLQDVQLMKTVAKGTEAKQTVDMISNVYVSGTTRVAYQGKYANLTPELYLTRSELMEHWIFGITDFRIDGESAYNRFKPGLKYEYNNLKKSGNLKPTPESKEENHIVTYNLIYNSGDETPIIVDSYTSQVHCSYMNDQWFITGLKSSYTRKEVEQEPFKEAYKTSIEETHDPKETVRKLRKHYTWLPDDRAMDDAAIEAEYQKNKYR